ncbi:heme exporter protein CcmD [Duganella sp. FT92W]|uniref:Heme exporter protein D n=1 Tax=Pseudoduganella rivuli TaxID=2666085 RepID=A0A7X2IR36_9BURK|nr:heme exporter protein CcmD [Pseudoduganella rivuli]MRV74428.1 heme exporter protein CcmD [Pseudoduganella rivuli]
MIWGSFAEFIAMGGYGLYVWGSVLVTGGGLALELALLSRRKRAALGAAALSARLALRGRRS